MTLGVLDDEDLELSLAPAGVPPEWSPHRRIWLGFPSHARLWDEALAPAQAEVAALATALAGPGGEQVRLIVSSRAALDRAGDLVAGRPGIEVELLTSGDVWLRDTGPIFLGAGRAAAFQFNGWGGKFVFEGDQALAGRLAYSAGADLTLHMFVLEGGALDHDGRGSAIATRQCLLNPNRNPGWDEAAAEQALGLALGVRKVLWFDEGLRNDHTDGHVDNLARFVAPGVIAVPSAQGADDPNAELYERTFAAASQMSDADGMPLRVARIPSPGRVLDASGGVAPASHMNFIIANRAVIVPTFGDGAAQAALAAIRSQFPDREVVGLPSAALLSGGGSFHCISQPEPMV